MQSFEDKLQVWVVNRITWFVIQSRWAVKHLGKCLAQLYSTMLRCVEANVQ